MAAYAHSTAAPARRLLPSSADFSPATIMARATAFAAESAARWAARYAAGKLPTVTDLRSPDELLIEIRREIERQANPPLLPVAGPLPSLTSALANRRAVFGAFDTEVARG